MLESPLNKFACLHPTALLKQILQQKSFPVNLANLSFRTASLTLKPQFLKSLKIGHFLALPKNIHVWKLKPPLRNALNNFI